MLFTRLFSSIPSVQFHSIQLQFLPAHFFICCHSKSTCQRQIYFSYILMFFCRYIFFFNFRPPVVQALLDNNCFGDFGLQSHNNKKANSRGLLHKMTRRHIPPSKATVKIGIDVEDVSPSPQLVITPKKKLRVETEKSR